MNDQKLIQIWGQELFDYCAAKSTELVGYASYEVMVMCAIGKLKDQGLFTFAPVVKL